MFSQQQLSFVSAIYLLISIGTLVTVARKGRAFWASPLMPRDSWLPAALALFVVHPLIVPIHELGHAIATWLSGGKVVEFSWEVFSGHIVRTGDFTALEDWWIPLVGNLASATVGVALLLLGILSKRLKPVPRAIALRSGYFELLFTFLMYPIMSFVGPNGDWKNIYRFDSMPLLSSATLILHLAIVGWLFWSHDRFEGAFRQTYQFAIPLRHRLSTREVLARRILPIVVVCAAVVFAYAATVTPKSGVDPGHSATQTEFVWDELDPWISEDSQEIFVHEDLFGRIRGSVEQWGFPINDSSVLIVADDADAAARALERAGRRFFFVVNDGRELHENHPDWLSGDFYGPGYVSNVERSPWGPTLWMDFEDAPISQPARRTMIAILRQELQRAEVYTALVMRAPVVDESWPNWKSLYPHG